MKAFLGALAVSAALTFMLAVLSARDAGRHWFDPILLAGYLVGTAVSGNLHAPDGFVVWATVLLIVFLPLWALATGGKALLGGRRRRGIR